MVHKDISEGNRGRPRGRPFAKGNKRGKLKNDVLASSGREIGDEGGVVAPNPHSAIVEEKNQQEDAMELQLPKKGVETIERTLKETMNTTQEEEKPMKEESKDLELIDALEFKNGENTLTIRFSKKHNRMFRIQVFLNNESEIRPVTYTGASTGYAFWNLLKGALKK